MGAVGLTPVGPFLKPEAGPSAHRARGHLLSSPLGRPHPEPCGLCPGVQPATLKTQGRGTQVGGAQGTGQGRCPEPPAGPSLAGA